MVQLFFAILIILIIYLAMLIKIQGNNSPNLKRESIEKHKIFLDNISDIIESEITPTLGSWAESFSDYSLFERESDYESAYRLMKYRMLFKN